MHDLGVRFGAVPVAHLLNYWGEVRGHDKFQWGLQCNVNPTARTQFVSLLMKKKCDVGQPR